MKKIFKAKQYRWEESADPLIEDVTEHKTLEEAIEQANKISLNIGFQAQVDEIVLDDDDDIIDIQTAYYGEENRGRSLEGCIIVGWSWEKHVGYSRNLIDIFKNHHRLEFEADLITGNEESTFKNNFSILLTKEEAEETDDLESLIKEELNRDYWKWNYFKSSPESEYIIERIKDLTI